MSEVGVAAPAARRSSMMGAAVQFAVLFLLVGPFVGTLVFVATAAVEALTSGQVDDPGSYLVNLTSGLPFLLPIGYLVGGIPALAAGLVVGLLDRWIRGWLLYPVALVIGAAPVGVFGFAHAHWQPIAWFTVVTVISTLACTAMARHVGLGRT